MGGEVVREAGGGAGEELEHEVERELVGKLNSGGEVGCGSCAGHGGFCGE